MNDIPQHEMQVLLWGVAAKAKMKQMPNRQQLLAARLLTPLELAAMEHDALGVIPPALRQQVYNALPREVRAVAEAENNLRGLLEKANATYAELEAVAVLRGPEPPPDRPVARTTIDRDGWTFVNRPARAAVQQFGFVRAGFRQPSLDRLRAWQARYERWNTEYRERAEWYKQRWACNTAPPPDVQQVLRDLDMDHYRAGIEAALTGGPAGQLNWLIEHQERMNAALERATLEIAGLGVMPDEFSPSDQMAVPAARGAQRLGLSARRFQATD